MSLAKAIVFAALLTGFLLLAAPAAAWPDGEAATLTAGAASTMPATLRLALIQSRAEEAGRAYRIDDNGHGANPRHGLDLAFTPAGVRIEGGDGGFSLRLERFGRGAGRPVRRAVPRIAGAWVEYDRGKGLTEWFVNLPRGVEQGWTVSERPAGEGPLVIELDTARPPDEGDDQRLAWSGLVYHRLVALDADGRELPALWKHDGIRLRIEVDDHEAAYPVLIDPWVEQTKLVAADGVAGDRFGSVALAGDTALVGAENLGGDLGVGAAYVFTRSDGVWSQQARLAADDEDTSDAFGFDVALSGDSALVGAFGAGEAGAAYVFTRSGGEWSQQAKLVADDAVTGGAFGFSVALDGDSALVGAPQIDIGGGASVGAAYVFTRDDGVWSQQARLLSDDGASGDRFGYSVAINGDTALVGVIKDGGEPRPGAAQVFTRSDGEWGMQAELTAADGMARDYFGSSVDLAEGSALVGAFGADVAGNDDRGAAYVFARSGGTWSQQAKLTADDGAASSWFGWSVALGDGVALAGAPGHNVDGTFRQGAAYVFTRSGETWSQQTELTAADGAAIDNFGASVALAGDVALSGAPAADVDGDVDQGAAYVFISTLVPAALEVDAVPLDSDGNGVFEPGERVEAAPSWRNDGGVPLTVSGTASGFTGPAGANYDLVAVDADYGTVAPDSTVSCSNSGVCYALEVDDPASRPAAHWDATLDELLTDPDSTPTTAKAWALHFGDSFADVPRTHIFYPWIETVLHHGVTSGCDETDYCPLGTSTRAQMPVFVLRAFLGPEFTPEPCVPNQERFDDVPASSPFCPWIEELAERGVVSGCGGGNYCPNGPVTRAQMAIFLLRTLEGADYSPPDCAGLFGDVNCPSLFADWIEELYNRGVTSGCTVDPLSYCPAGTNIRGQMAVFLGKAFGLTLYGP